MILLQINLHKIGRIGKVNWKLLRPILFPETSPIPRYPGNSIYELHGFSYASNVAYAGVVYLRALYTDSTVSVTLLMAKT